METQRLLMGKGAKELVVRKNKKGKVGAGTADEDWGVTEKGGGLPESEEGLVTGARVWVGFSFVFS